MICRKMMSKHYDKIYDGKKDYTIRVYDEELATLKPGDEICFIEVTNLRRRVRLSHSKMICRIDKIEELPENYFERGVSGKNKQDFLDMAEALHGEIMRQGVRYLKIWLRR